MMRRVMIVAFALLGAIAVSSQALAAITGNQRFSESGNVTTCSGEVVDVQVDGLLLGRVTTDATGGVHQGVTVTALIRGTSPSGASYIGPFHQTMEINGDLGSENNNTFTMNGELILKGENGTADDLRSRAVFHFTINANGELVSSKAEFTFDCA